MTAAWSAQAEFSNVCARVGGRRRINAIRKKNAELRRRKVADLLFRQGMLGKPQAKKIIAALLGVSYCTITRDYKHLMRHGWRCHHCGRNTKKVD